MKIASATIALQGQHFSETRSERSESLRSWIGNERPNFEGKESTASAPSVSISDSARQAQAGSAGAVKPADDGTTTDPILRMLEIMLEWITGQPVKIFRASDFLTGGTAAANSAAAQSSSQGNAAAPRAGYGVEYDRHAVYEETEETRFSATGTVRTTDGHEIAVRLDAAMSRHYREENNVSVRLGDARRKDPLVINFAGTAAQLSNQRFRFDLMGNGNAEEIPLLASGSGYLALDLNGNGRIDSGAELFGPTSGSGYAELTKYDDDHNGWIDENDAVYSRLRLWTPDGAGHGELASLQEKDVGAIHLGRAATPFELRGDGNTDLGAVKDTGIYLKESGGVGTVQEIDLTV